MLTGRDRDAVDADLLGAASRGESGPARRWVTLRGALALAVAAGTLVGMATAVPAHATEEDAEPVRIMPFGDSITQGSAGDHTWRWFLDRHLRASGQEFDFVGPRHSVASLEGWPWETGYAEEDFDQDHAGWWGNSMVWPLDPGVRTLMEEFRPQVVVLNGSANDVGFWNESADRVLERLRRWVAAAREVNPGTAFVLSEMTIDDAPGYAELNAWLPFLAQELDEESSPVVLARAAEGFVPASGPGMPADTWDTKHPNTSGSQKIAAAVADALAELGVGTPYHVPRQADAPRSRCHTPRRRCWPRGASACRGTWFREPPRYGWSTAARQPSRPGTSWRTGWAPATTWLWMSRTCRSAWSTSSGSVPKRDGRSPRSATPPSC